MRKPAEYIEYEDLNESCQYVADVLGMEPTRKLIGELGYIIVEVPNAANMRNLKERYVLEHYGIFSIKRIARELNRSEKTIRRIIKKLRTQGKLRDNR